MALSQYKDGFDLAYIATKTYDDFMAEAKEQTEAVAKHGGAAWYSNFGVEQDRKLRELYDAAEAYGKDKNISPKSTSKDDKPKK
jgi:hypothetical protein